MYPRHNDAREHCMSSNKRWKDNGWEEAYTVVRFQGHFRGTEIDIYEHKYERHEKP